MHKSHSGISTVILQHQYPANQMTEPSNLNSLVQRKWSHWNTMLVPIITIKTLHFLQYFKNRDMTKCKALSSEMCTQYAGRNPRSHSESRLLENVLLWKGILTNFKAFCPYAGFNTRQKNCLCFWVSTLLSSKS